MEHREQLPTWSGLFEFMYSLKKRLNQILAHHTGKTVEDIERDADRDNYMPAEDAAAYGLIDKVLEKNSADK